MPPASGNLNSHKQLSALTSLDINVPVKHTSCATPKLPLPRQAFDLSTSKSGHGSPVSWASFVSIFSFLHPSVLDLRSVRDRQTDRQRRSMHYASAIWGRGIRTAYIRYKCMRNCYYTQYIKLFFQSSPERRNNTTP